MLKPQAIKTLRHHLISALALLGPESGTDHDAIAAALATVSPPTLPSPDELPFPLPPLPADAYRTLQERIVDALREHGPLTFKELYARIPGFSPTQIYRQSYKNPDSLVARGIAVFRKSPQPGKLTIAPDFTGDASEANPPLSTYVAEILAADKEANPHSALIEHDTVVIEFAKAQKVYVERILWAKHNKAYGPNHTMRGMRSRGLVDLIKHVVTRPDDSALHECVAGGYPQATAEWAVLHSPDAFPRDSKIFKVAYSRMDAAMEAAT